MKIGTIGTLHVGTDCYPCQTVAKVNEKCVVAVQLKESCEEDDFDMRGQNSIVILRLKNDGRWVEDGSRNVFDDTECKYYIDPSF